MNRTGIENRRSPRRVFAHSVGVLYRGEFEICQAHQLSEGGIFLEMPWALQAGEWIVVTLFVNGGYSVTRAEIRYVSKMARGQGYGCQFAELPLAQRRLIRNYVSAKTKEEAASENFN